MDKRTTGIIATIATAILCGCCSLFGCVMGIGTITGNGNFTLGDTVQPMPPTYGYVFLCLSVIFIAVPIVVGFVTLRKRPEEVEPVSNEPLPPTS
ncbi:MAG: hypothetical protein ACK2TX_00175 [Anaerolineales bacterium]